MSSIEYCGLSSSFKDRPVVCLFCNCCTSCICDRGVRARLVAKADANEEYFSTDLPSGARLRLVNAEYVTGNCLCRLRDVACQACGSIVGYHVLKACRPCLRASHNGHYWIFKPGAVYAQERLVYEGDGGVDVMSWRIILGQDATKSDKDVSDDDAADDDDDYAGWCR